MSPLVYVILLSAFGGACLGLLVAAGYAHWHHVWCPLCQLCRVLGGRHSFARQDINLATIEFQERPPR